MLKFEKALALCKLNLQICDNRTEIIYDIARTENEKMALLKAKNEHLEQKLTEMLSENVKLWAENRYCKQKHERCGLRTRYCKPRTRGCSN